MPEYNFENKLGTVLSGAKRVVVAGIGNPIRMDDFVGIEIVRLLQGKVSKNVYLIECETVPEGFAQQIIDFEPTHVILIDAAILGLKPGESVVAKPEQLTGFPAFSTHILPLRLFCEYVTRETGSRISLVLIQPKTTDFGEGLTPELAATARSVADILLKVLAS